ncbi:MAG: ATP-binding protein [Candidatus Altiarchaeota archaeon]|nr:ATP-binding protein [Candidatus Altiarchaeota archaeon]
MRETKKTKTQFRVVLSGGTCNGKTTTLRELEKLCKIRGIDAGFVEEAARDILKNSIESGSTCLPWTNPRWFQLRLFRFQNKRERAPKNNLVFLDRCKVDGLIYYWLDSLKVHPVVLRGIEKERYDLVFFLAPLPHRKDTERVENTAVVRKIAVLAEKAYQRFGYTPIEVPLLSPRKRAKFILERSLLLLKEKQSK